jgi:DNA-binding response OmpR family regulator
MAKRILFFESDADFAREVSAKLRRHGAEVEVTDDGNAGVDRATKDRLVQAARLAGAAVRALDPRSVQ